MKENNMQSIGHVWGWGDSIITKLLTMQDKEQNLTLRTYVKQLGVIAHTCPSAREA